MSAAIILAGRPNSGKTTLFNRLAGTNQKVGNYAGCTVEKKSSIVHSPTGDFELTDLPGLYSIKPNTIDEEVALKHLDESRVSAHVVFVVDGNNLEQELILPFMLRKKGMNISVAVNMMDEVRANHKVIDFSKLKERTGADFFPIAAKTGEGVDELKSFLAAQKGNQRAALAPSLLSLSTDDINGLHQDAKLEARIAKQSITKPKENFLLERDVRIDAILLHRFLGPVLFLATMFFLFQSIFTWAKPLSDGLNVVVGLLQEIVKLQIASPFFSSLLSDGVLAGVGAVITFVPQIGILFLLIGILEYSGYLPRVAYMVDRLMKPFGLEGKVFIPLLSSVACAVPGIMATRTIENEKTRITTIMISPLMTCSARLPVYTLLIATFIPNIRWAGLSLPGLVMFSMYLLGIVSALAVAVVLRYTPQKTQKTVLDLIHLPHYRVPDFRLLLKYVWERIAVFVKKAGTIIAAMTVALWLLLSFPKDQPFLDLQSSKITHIQNNEKIPDPEKARQIEALANEAAAHSLEYSAGGHLGKFLAPVFQPIGYDWKLTIGVISSLAAREVFVSTLGTVFALGNTEAHLDGLTDTLRKEKKPDGTPAYTVATCLSLLVFFAFSLQCISTITIAHRETNSWKIPAIMFAYMFVLAYGTAFLLYHGTMLFFT